MFKIGRNRKLWERGIQPAQGPTLSNAASNTGRVQVRIFLKKKKSVVLHLNCIKSLGKNF